MILSNEAKDAMLQGLADELNVDVNASLIIYIDADEAAIFDMPNPIEQSITGGVFTFNLPQRSFALLSGTPTTAKLINGLGVVIAEFTIGGEIALDKPAFYLGGYVNITGLKITI